MSGPIWKYRLKPEWRQVIEVDGPMRWLGAGMQGDDLVVWAIVTGKEFDKRSVAFRVVCTGQHADPQWEHIATIQRPDGTVLHLFKEA
jgi:hypothetical protein